VFERLLRIKQWKLLKPFFKEDKEANSGGGAGKIKSFFHYFFNF
jgi:hypothetical protein